MKKSEIFDLLLDKVCEVCEVRKESVIGGVRYQSVVDSRILLVQYLRRIGFSNDEIALIFIRKKANDNDLFPSTIDLKKKAKGIDKLFKGYSDRCLQSYSFCLMSLEIKEFCRKTYSELYLAGMKELPPTR